MRQSTNTLTHSHNQAFLNLFVAVGYFVGAGDHEVGGVFVQVAGHDVWYIAQGVLFFVVEVSHEEEADLVLAHEVKQFVVLLFGQVGGGGGAVVVGGAEEAGVGGYHHVAVFVAVLQQLAQPLQLATAVGSVAAVEEDEEVFGTPHSLHGDGVGGGVEILLEVLLTVEIDVVVADGDETGVRSRVATHQAVQLTEGTGAAFVGYVAVDDAEEALGVGSFGTQKTLHAVGVALEVDVGTDVDAVLVGGTGDDGGGVLVVPFEPLGYTVLGMGAMGEEHAGDVEAVAGSKCQCGCEDEEVLRFHVMGFLKGSYCAKVEKPTVVGGCEVERAYGVDAYFGIEMCVLRQLVEGFGTEEPVGHTLDDKVVVIAPADADIPLPGNELVVPPAFDGKHDVHGFEDGALAAVAALDEFSNISVAETEMEVEMPGMPSHL